MKTVDKFGHYRGYQGNRSGPPGLGFVEDRDGNYDMMSKRLKNVRKGTDLNDVATMEHVVKLFESVDTNSKNLQSLNKVMMNLKENFFDNFPKTLATTLEANKTTILDPSIKSRVDTIILDMKAELTKTVKNIIDIEFVSKVTKIENSIKQSQTKIDKLDKEIKKIKDDAQSELKAVADMTRSFVYKVTSPSYQRNSEEKEESIHLTLKKPHSSWNHAFPEVKKGGS